LCPPTDRLGITAASSFTPKGGEAFEAKPPAIGRASNASLKPFEALEAVSGAEKSEAHTNRRRAETGKNKGNNKLFLNVRVARLRVAVATELLFRARGSLAEVTEEVAGILKGHSILTNRKGKFFSGERTVRRWRSEIVADVSSFDAKEYNKILDQITSQVRARGGGPDELVQAAHAMLQNLEKTTLPD
jgi:hypothetical protein